MALYDNKLKGIKTINENIVYMMIAEYLYEYFGFDSLDVYEGKVDYRFYFVEAIKITIEATQLMLKIL